MSESVFKAPRAKKSPSIMEDEELAATSVKKPRTSEDFYSFCKFILEYENYDTVKQQEELREKAVSPVGSIGSVADSVKSESNASSLPDERKSNDVDVDEDSYDLVTCYCAKPFAGRPMIECGECLTWLHLSCAKVRKSNIPEVFTCVRCKQQQCNGSSPHSDNAYIRHGKKKGH